MREVSLFHFLWDPLSVEASDERAQAIVNNVFKLVPRLSGWIRAQEDNEEGAIFF